MATTDVALERTSLSRSGAIRPTTRRSNPGGPRGARIDSIFGRAAAAAQPDHSDAVRVWNLHAVDALFLVHRRHGCRSCTSRSCMGPCMTPSTPSTADTSRIYAASHRRRRRLRWRPRHSNRSLIRCSSGSSYAAVVSGGRDRLDALYAETLAGIPDGSAKPDGIAAGAAAARGARPGGGT